MVGEALKMRTKSVLTLRLEHYSAEVQRTFMLTYVRFMVVNICHFFTVCRRIRKFSAGVGSVASAPKYCRS